MDTGLKEMGTKKNYYSTEDITIPVLNTRSIKSTINFIARGIRERVKEIQETSSYFIKDMIAKGRFEVYLKLKKIDKGKEVTNFIYQINTVVREQRKVY